MEITEKIGQIVLGMGWPSTPVSWMPRDDGDYEIYLRRNGEKLMIIVPKEIVENLPTTEAAKVILEIFESNS